VVIYGASTLLGKVEVEENAEGKFHTKEGAIRQVIKEFKKEIKSVFSVDLPRNPDDGLY